MHEMGFWPGKGYVLWGMAEMAAEWLDDMHCRPTLMVADPPYGHILNEEWDKVNVDISKWIDIVQGFERWKCPQYWWGGIGKQRMRPFFNFILDLENVTNYRMRDLITWKKVRAYGKAKDYLFTREECAYLTYKGQDPSVFNIPLLDERRGYDGYNKDYPCKSEFKRRSNVWIETELLGGKIHPAQKAPRIVRIPIEVHTNPNDLVVDLYSGSGEMSVQALAMGRQFVAVESNRETAKKIAERIGYALNDLNGDS